MIDDDSGQHIAAGCDGRIRYSVQAGTDGNWDTTEFAPPVARAEYDPQLAVQGGVLYLAYTRVAVEEGDCANRGLRDVGVYVRSRALPRGAWSEPTLIGEIGDHLQSFRVFGSGIHATVANAEDGETYYEALHGETYQRYPIPLAEGAVALRIGGDGAARIAFEADGAIRYGLFTGSAFSSAKIDGTSNGFGPVLVLGAADRPYLLWRRGYDRPFAGCALPGPDPGDGTYYGTNVGDAWQSEQLTPVEGVASLTIDVDSGRIHALVSGEAGLAYRSKSEGQAWSMLTFSDVHAQDAVIRHDPVTGVLLVAYIQAEGGGTRVYVTQYR